MSIPLIVRSKTFNYPSIGEDPGWGEDATKWAREVTRVLESLAGPNDILETNFTIANNTTSATNINGLLFNVNQVRSAEIKYSVDRSTSLSELSESGTIQIVYNTTAGTWALSKMSVGNAGVTFSVTNGGQFQYISTNMSGASYTGTLTFKASTLES